MEEISSTKNIDMSLIAKPIVKDQLWVVTDGTNKVGNVEYTGDGYSLKIGNRIANFESKKDIKRLVEIQFQRPVAPPRGLAPWAVWPTTGRTHNDMFDIKRKLHIYTKTKKSRCYHAAGWFRIKMGDAWQTVFCPKYIFVQRYQYTGPYMSMDEAENTK